MVMAIPSKTVNGNVNKKILASVIFPFIHGKKCGWVSPKAIIFPTNIVTNRNETYWKIAKAYPTIFPQNTLLIITIQSIIIKSIAQITVIPAKIFSIAERIFLWINCGYIIAIQIANCKTIMRPNKVVRIILVGIG